MKINGYGDANIECEVLPVTSYRRRVALRGQSPARARSLGSGPNYMYIRDNLLPPSSLSTRNFGRLHLAAEALARSVSFRVW